MDRQGQNRQKWTDRDNRNGQKWAEMDINGQKGAEMDKKTDKITQPTTRRVPEYSTLDTRASTCNTRARSILDFQYST